MQHLLRFFFHLQHPSPPRRRHDHIKIQRAAANVAHQHRRLSVLAGGHQLVRTVVGDHDERDAQLLAGGDDVQQCLVVQLRARLQAEVVQHQKVQLEQGLQQTAAHFPIAVAQAVEQTQQAGHVTLVAPVRQRVHNFGGHITFARPGPAVQKQARSVLPQGGKLFHHGHGQLPGPGVFAVVVLKIPMDHHIQLHGLAALLHPGKILHVQLLFHNPLRLLLLQLQQTGGFQLFRRLGIHQLFHRLMAFLP